MSDTPSDLATVHEASKATGVPARTIREWYRTTSAGKARIARYNRGTTSLVSLAEVEALAATYTPKARGGAKKKSKKADEKITVEEFARITGASKSTVYKWKSGSGDEPSRISDYTRGEAERMRAEREKRKADRSAAPTPASAPVRRVDAPDLEEGASLAQKRAREIVLLDEKIARARGEVFLAEPVLEIVRDLAAEFRLALDRAGLDVTQRVIVVLDQHGFEITPSLRQGIQHAVADGVSGRARDGEQAIEEIRARHFAAVGRSG